MQIRPKIRLSMRIQFMRPWLSWTRIWNPSHWQYHQVVEGTLAKKTLAEAAFAPWIMPTGITYLLQLLSNLLMMNAKLTEQRF